MGDSPSNEKRIADMNKEEADNSGDDSFNEKSLN